VKIGEVQTGALNSNAVSQQPSFFSEDFFRFRVRWTELQLILNELQQAESSRWSATKTFASRLPFSPRSSTSPKTPVQGRRNFSEANEILQQPVATIIFSRFTFDFQRVFKTRQRQTGPFVFSMAGGTNMLVKQSHRPK
jgi:hypothetical protein